MLKGGLLYEYLRHALGGSHDAGGTHGLVGRDQHEVLRVALRGGAEHVAGPEHVVGDGLGDVAFHQRHMLVCRRVEHGVGAKVSEDAPDTRHVPHIRDHRRELDRRMLRPQLVQDLEDLVFAVSEQHEVARSELRQLAGQLAPDGAACARDQHRSAGHDGAHRCEVGADGLAAEQVLNLHLAQVRQADAARQDLEQGRDRAGGDAGVQRGAHHAPYDAAGGSGDRDDDLVHAVLANESGNPRERPEHRDVVQAGIPLARVVVHEPHGCEAELRVGAQLAQNHFAGGTCPCDQRASCRSRLRGALQRSESADEEARRGDDHDGKERV